MFGKQLIGAEDETQIKLFYFRFKISVYLVRIFYAGKFTKNTRYSYIKKFIYTLANGKVVTAPHPARFADSAAFTHITLKTKGARTNAYRRECIKDASALGKNSSKNKNGDYCNFKLH